VCGIVGIYNRSGDEVDRAVLQEMTGVLQHRGSDDVGYWVEGPIGFGHQRLAIRDLSQAGHQPMLDADGLVVVTYNGEIYNCDELRLELTGQHRYRFLSTSDTEVILAGYLAWGDAVFERLEGMFALGIWDSRHRRLLLARDGAGIKPLFISDTGTQVRFASEIKSLLRHPEQSRRIDELALHEFFATGYPGPARTTLAGICQLPPGTVRCIDERGITDRQFWRPARNPDILDLNQAVEMFEEAWGPVIRDSLVSDVPVGVLQSGGIDSSLITMALRNAEPAPCLFTAGYDEQSHDETALARAIAQSAGLEHEVVPIGADPDPEATFRSVVYHLDGQLADSSAYSQYRLFARVRERLKVVLAGDGADEFFGGYYTYRASRVAARLAPLVPGSAAGGIGRFLSRRRGGDERRLPAGEKAARFFLGLHAGRFAHTEWRRLMPAHMQVRLYGPSLLRATRAANPLAGYRSALESMQADLVDACMVADQSYYLPGDGLRKVDAMSMAHSLEVRVPFLDRRIMELSGRIHSSVLAPLAGPEKKVLRAALARTGITRDVTAAQKRGFNTPIARLLRTGLDRLGFQLLDQRADRLDPYLNPQAVRALWLEHSEGSRNHGYLLWCLLTFAVWLELLESGYRKPG
jgi:asparagine synthase (glutamine-hydrolysing)